MGLLGWAARGLAGVRGAWACRGSRPVGLPGFAARGLAGVRGGVGLLGWRGGACSVSRRGSWWELKLGPGVTARWHGLSRARRSRRTSHEGERARHDRGRARRRGRRSERGVRVGPCRGSSRRRRRAGRLRREADRSRRLLVARNGGCSARRSRRARAPPSAGRASSRSSASVAHASRFGDERPSDSALATRRATISASVGAPSYGWTRSVWSSRATVPASRSSAWSPGRIRSIRSAPSSGSSASSSGAPRPSQARNESTSSAPRAQGEASLRTASLPSAVVAATTHARRPPGSSAPSSSPHSAAAAASRSGTVSIQARPCSPPIRTTKARKPGWTTSPTR